MQTKSDFTKVVATFQASATVPQLGCSHRTGLLALCAYLALVVARATEMLAIGLGMNLRIAMVLLGVAIASGFLSGQLIRVLQSRITVLLGLTTAWFLMAVPFSVHKGGSVNILIGFWLTSLLVYAGISMLVVTLDDVRWVMYSVAAGVVVLVTFTFLLGSAESGRLQLLLGTLANPNLLGLHLLFGLPFCLLPVFRHGLWSFRGLLAGSFVLLTLLTTIRTGSRQALIAMLGMILFAFWHASLPGKFKLLAATALMAVVGVAIAPQGALERYETLVASDAAASPVDDAAAGAVQSRAARIYHFRQSVELTIQNPIFGIGPGEFMVAAADLSRDVGERAAWRETHNSLTQVSSEAGIPALLFYSLFIFFCMKPLASVYHSTCNSPQFRDIGHIAFCLLLSYISTTISSLFVSIAYQIYFPMLGAITLAFLYSARVYMLSVPAQPVQATSAGVRRPQAYPAGYTPVGSSAAPRNRRSRGVL